MPNLTKVLLQGSRPKTLIASISPVLSGTIFAYKAGSFNPLIFLSTLLCALLIQMLTNLANDYFDYKKGSDTATRIGPQRIMQAGLINESTMIKTLVLISFAVILSAIPLIQTGGLFIAKLVSVALLFAFLYSATPFAFAYTGFADFIVFFCFGPLAFYVTQALQTNFLPCSPLLGVGSGAISAALLTLNNLRDFNEDKKANKKTLVVRFGLYFGKTQLLFYTLILYSPLLILYKNYSVFLIATILTLFLTLKLCKCKSSHEFASHFPKIGLYFWLYTLFYCSYLFYL